MVPGTGKECIVSNQYETINTLWIVSHLKAFLQSCLFLNEKAQECFLAEDLPGNIMFPA